MELSGNVARMGKERGTYRFLVREPHEKQQLGRPKRRRKNNIKVDLREIERGVD